MADSVSAVVSRASHAKGVALRGLLAWYESAYGHARLVEAIQRLPEDLARFLDADRELLGVLPSSWYPVSLVHALLDELLRDFGSTERAAMAEAAATHVMSSTLGGIYRRLIELFATPQLYARFAQKLWNAYYDTGVFQVRCIGERSTESSVSGWAGHNEFTCDLNLHAATLIHQAMGLKGVVSERKSCVAQGAPSCRFVTTWR